MTESGRRTTRHVFRPEDAQLVDAVPGTEFGFRSGNFKDGNKVVHAGSRPHVLQRPTDVGYRLADRGYRLREVADLAQASSLNLTKLTTRITSSSLRKPAHPLSPGGG